MKYILLLLLFSLNLSGQTFFTYLIDSNQFPVFEVIEAYQVEEETSTSFVYGGLHYQMTSCVDYREIEVRTEKLNPELPDQYLELGNGKIKELSKQDADLSLIAGLPVIYNIKVTDKFQKDLFSYPLKVGLEQITESQYLSILPIFEQYNTEQISYEEYKTQIQPFLTARK